MRALELEAWGQMAVAEIAEPTPGPGEVILEIIATGICGSDIHGFTGQNDRRILGQVMGHESVGRVHAIGEGVDASRAPIGAIATFNPVIISEAGRQRFAGREQHDPEKIVIGVAPSRISAFAHRIVVPVVNLVLLPSAMPISYGALIEPLAVALNAVRRVRIVGGESVLVVGGGPIGQSATLAAFHEGAATVYVSEPNAGRRNLCTSLGAIALDPGEGSVAEQIIARQAALVDVAIDAVGVSETLADALVSTSFGGRVCLVGMGEPGLSLEAYRVSTEERSIVGSFCYSVQTFNDAAEWVGRGGDVFAKLISAEVPLQDAQSAFERLATKADVPGKILVTF